MKSIFKLEKQLESGAWVLQGYYTTNKKAVDAFLREEFEEKFRILEYEVKE